jgi:hypothetical protein
MTALSVGLAIRQTAKGCCPGHNLVVRHKTTTFRKSCLRRFTNLSKTTVPLGLHLPITG